MNNDKIINIDDCKEGFMLHLKHTKEDEVYIDIVPYNDGLDYLRKKIDCDTIDIVARRFNDKPYQLIVDDEGLLAQKPFTLASVNYDEILVGNILICKSNHYDNLLGMTISECIELARYLFKGGRYTF